MGEIASMLEARVGISETQRESKRLMAFLDWTQKYRIIRNKRTGVYGPFELIDYPWLKPLYDAVGTFEPGLNIRIRKAAQMGLTEFAINASFYAIDAYGARIFYALPPGLSVVGDFAHDRIGPAIGNSPYIRSMLGETDNVGLKTFTRGALYIRTTSAQSGRPDKSPQLSAVPADIAIIDEWDRVPPAALPLIHDRMGDSLLKIEIGLSTPTFPGIGIDEQYQKTDQREPMIQCQACKHWHWLEWAMVAELRGIVAVWCPNCQRPIERRHAWIEGRMRYEAQEPGSEVIGFWFSKLVSPRVRLSELWERSQAVEVDQTLAFWNNDLGLPYEPQGARLTREMLNACVEDYTFPSGCGWSAMGVDVGAMLTVWILEPRPHGKQRAVYIGEVLTWEDLDTLMVRYGVHCCVVDDAPELREDVAFVQRHRGRAFLANYVEEIRGNEWVTWNLKRQEARIDRTAGLDRAHNHIEAMWDELPKDFMNIKGFVEHMTVNVKVKAKRADGTDCYKFPRTGRPDHYAHAKVYVEAALERLLKLPAPGEQDADGDEVPRGGKSRYRGRA